MENQHLATTRVALDGQTTVCGSELSEEGADLHAGKGSRQLEANYRSIINTRAIYYPVAYRFLKELGRGRQGIVFQGLRQGARGCMTRHAIKLFDPSIYSSAKKYWTDMGRISLQTSRLQLVKNPSLVAPDIYEESNGIGYIQMEVIDGIGLRELMDGRHLELVKRRSTSAEWARFTDAIFRVEKDRISIQPGIALYIMRQVLRGLETLHAMGFIHSDVKPGNVMIDRLGYVKLVDYGRAVIIDEKVSILMGTPAYMAPEMHRREASAIQSDFFSLGLVGLEMLCGRPLLPKVDKITDKDLLNYKLHLALQLQDILPEHVRQNAQFVILLQRFLDPDPARRYSSAEEAEVGSQGLVLVHKQLVQLGKDTEYGRELENYIAKVLTPIAGTAEKPPPPSTGGPTDKSMA